MKLFERILAMQHFDPCYPVPHPLCAEVAAALLDCENAIEESIQYQVDDMYRWADERGHNPLPEHEIAVKERELLAMLRGER